MLTQSSRPRLIAHDGMAGAERRSFHVSGERRTIRDRFMVTPGSPGHRRIDTILMCLPSRAKDVATIQEAMHG